MAEVKYAIRRPGPRGTFLWRWMTAEQLAERVQACVDAGFLDFDALTDGPAEVVEALDADS